MHWTFWLAESLVASQKVQLYGEWVSENEWVGASASEWKLVRACDSKPAIVSEWEHESEWVRVIYLVRIVCSVQLVSYKSYFFILSFYSQSKAIPCFHLSALPPPRLVSNCTCPCSFCLKILLLSTSFIISVYMCVDCCSCCCMYFKTDP